MAHFEQQEFCACIRKRYARHFQHVTVLDIGSLDINGNNRWLFDEAKYLGVDLMPGKNVDVVCHAHELLFEPESFDTIISTECLEHDQQWKRTLAKALKLLKPGGLLVLTCATDGRPEHGTVRNSPADSPATPEYYRNLTEADLIGALDLGQFEEFSFEVDDGLHDLRFVGMKKPIRLSLCMIVRNSTATLPACLESIRPWVDEMVVVDTGSEDNTPQIAKNFDARVFHFPWCDDFSVARNESVRRARGEWIFWMDSDDTIDDVNGRRLRELVEQANDSQAMAYVMQVHCPGENADVDVTVVDHVKMFRNIPALKFEGRIHEQILPAIRRASGEVAWTDIFVVHSGADHSPQARRRKQQRDLRLLHLELADRPEHPFVLFNLGMTYADMDEPSQAVEALTRCLQVSDKSESHVRKAYALLVNAQYQLDQHTAAEQLCRQGLEQFPDDPELMFRLGMLAQFHGKPEEAVRCYRDVLASKVERHFSSVDHGIRGFKTRHNLALVYLEIDRLGEAELEWRRALEEAPAFVAGWRGLSEVLLKLGRHVTAEIEVERMLETSQLQPVGAVLRGWILAHRGQDDAAKAQFQFAVSNYPDELEPLEALCRFLFERGNLDEAELALEELARRSTLDGAAHHNLGTVYLTTGRAEQAAEAYRRSLEVRPDAPQTYRQLGYALIALGRHDEADEAWRRAQRLAPHEQIDRPAETQATGGT